MLRCPPRLSCPVAVPAWAADRRLIQRPACPGAITFDEWGALWVVESNVVAPEVRTAEVP